MKSDQKRNVRGYNRRTSYIIVEYRVKEGIFRDILKNVGATGLFVNTTRNVAANQSIELKFPLFAFEEQIEVKGRVVRSSPTGFAVELDQPITEFITKGGKLPDIVHEIDREG